MRMTRWFGELPLLARCAVLGGLLAGVPGCVAGLVIGLYTYPPTAWFATFELGIPAALVGAIIAVSVGSVVLTQRRLRRFPRAGRAQS